MKTIIQSFILFLLCTYPSSIIFSQQLDVNNNTFFFPHAYYSSQIISSLGLSVAKLPEEVFETDDVFRGPLFSYRLKYGLPENFLAEGGVETNFITFHFSLGPKWNYVIERWGFSVGTDIAYWFGQLEQFGFGKNTSGIDFAMQEAF